MFSILRSDGERLISKCRDSDTICSVAVLIAPSVDALVMQLATGKITESYYLQEFVKQALDSSSVVEAATGDIVYYWCFEDCCMPL